MICLKHYTRKFIKEIKISLSPARANRPTNNGRQEQWYRTVKQEEIYCYPAYMDEKLQDSVLKNLLKSTMKSGLTRHYGILHRVMPIESVIKAN